MTEIKLTKRYPLSRTEDITDAYMRGWNDALDAVQNGYLWDCTKCGYCLTSWESYPKCDCPRCGATEQTEREGE